MLTAQASAGGGGKRTFYILEIGHKNQNFLENNKPAAQFRLFGLILAMTVYLPERHTLHKSQVLGLGVM